MLQVMGKVMPALGIPDKARWPNACNLNLYDDGAHSVAWHADDENMFQGLYRDIWIISLSLGASRTFELKLKSSSGNRAAARVTLADADLCTMEGLFQKHYMHRIPKEESTGARINLTWRWVLQHRSGCEAS